MNFLWFMQPKDRPILNRFYVGTVRNYTILSTVRRCRYLLYWRSLNELTQTLRIVVVAAECVCLITSRKSVNFKKKWSEVSQSTSISCCIIIYDQEYSGNSRLREMLMNGFSVFTVPRTKTTKMEELWLWNVSPEPGSVMFKLTRNW